MRLLITRALLLGCLLAMLPAASVLAQTPAADQRLVIVFTHDLHSYLAPVRAAAAGGTTVEQGGYARIARTVQQLRAQHGDRLLLVDAGDISMGTLFHTISPAHAPELRAMGKIGYDATTFGNHDFDLHADNLARMLQAARASGERLPALLSSNIVISQDNARGRALAQAFNDYPVRDYLVLVRNGLRIGLFGLMGRDASEDIAQPHDVVFTGMAGAARRVVDILQNQEKVDVIVALSHAGTWADKSRSEDELLAHAVPQIDVIISGHTHTTLAQPIVVGKTYVASAGCYGAHVGLLQLDFAGGTGGRLVGYDLLPVTADIADDPQLAHMVDAYRQEVNAEFLSSLNLRFDQVLAQSAFDFEPLAAIYAGQHESGLGNLVADAYRAAVSQAEGSTSEYVHVAFEPLGMIRDSIVRGNLTVDDVFRVLSLGLGPDGEIGIPLAAFYLTGDEIKQALKVGTTLAPEKHDLFLQVSGVKVTYDPQRGPFDRVTSLQIGEPDGTYLPAEAQQLYRVVVNDYFSPWLATIDQKSGGHIHLVPKDRDGNPIADLDTTLVHTSGGQSDRLLKEWQALALYLRSFPDVDGDGIPNIPARYASPEGRIVVAGK